MAKVGRVNFPNPGETRLLLSGEWSPECDAELQRGGFDRLELHGGEYPDFSCLVPYADSIKSLWINAPAKSAAGLNQLLALEDLSISYNVGSRLDFSVLPRLRRLNVDGWLPRYEETLFAAGMLQALRIDGYAGVDCGKFASLPNLQSLTLAKGSLTTLHGLGACGRLEAVHFSHLRMLQDISELALLPMLKDVELGSGLASLKFVDVVVGLAQLERLYLPQVSVQFPDVRWLEKFDKLRVLSLPGVIEIDWRMVFHSKALRQVTVRSARPVSMSLDDLKGLARASGLKPLEGKIVGTRKSPVYFLEFGE